MRYKKHLALFTSGFIIASGLLIGAIWYLAAAAQAPTYQSDHLSQLSSNAASDTFSAEDAPGLNYRITANSYLVVDSDTKQILASKGPNIVLSIASLTKLMTAYLVLTHGTLNEVITITPQNVVAVSPTLGLQVGDKVLVADLLNAMLVGSANDAASTLGSYLEQKQKVSMVTQMNTAAEQLGMADTHYSTPIGFDSDTNYSTAADLLKLVLSVERFPALQSIDRLHTYQFNSELGKSYSVLATNKLLAQDSEIHAIKTGFTDDAQGAMITRIQHNNNNFIIIVLHSTNREQDTLLLKSEIIKKYYSNIQLPAGNFTNTQ